jgi:hypothetical protein
VICTLTTPDAELEMKRRAIAGEVGDGVQRLNRHGSSGVEREQILESQINIEAQLGLRFRHIMNTFRTLQAKRMRTILLRVFFCITTAALGLLCLLGLTTTGLAVAAFKWSKEATPPLRQHQYDAADGTQELAQQSLHNFGNIPCGT